MNDTPNEFIRAREAMGLTITDLSARIRVSRQAIYKWERGETRPNPLARRALAAAFLLPEEIVDGWFNKAA